MTDEVVKLTEAESEAEAAMLCGYLETHGVRATYDKGGVGFLPTSPFGIGTAGGAAGLGRQQILVRAEDAKRALELLALLP